jgi:hypothetical protein
MKICHFCDGREDEVPGPWVRAEFLDSYGEEAWVCSRSRGAYLPGEPDDELPDVNTCRGRLLDVWGDRFFADLARRASMGPR